jgi:hypothetical protein
VPRGIDLAGMPGVACVLRWLATKSHHPSGCAGHIVTHGDGCRCALRVEDRSGR